MGDERIFPCGKIREQWVLYCVNFLCHFRFCFALYFVRFISIIFKNLQIAMKKIIFWSGIFLSFEKVLIFRESSFFSAYKFALILIIPLRFSRCCFGSDIQSFSGSLGFNSADYFPLIFFKTFRSEFSPAWVFSVIIFSFAKISATFFLGLITRI